MDFALVILTCLLCSILKFWKAEHASSYFILTFHYLQFSVWTAETSEKEQMRSDPLVRHVERHSVDSESFLCCTDVFWIEKFDNVMNTTFCSNF